MDRATVKRRQILEKYPSLYINIIRLRHLVFNTNFFNSIVNANTDIVIEGFPRSANSYAVEAFKNTQPYHVNIATHVHSSAHIIQSVRLNKPTLVLIRKPSAAIPSFKALMIEYNPQKKDIILADSPDYLINYYIDFYEALLPFKKKFVIATFDDVIKSFGSIVDKINTKYGTSFCSLNPDKKTSQKIFDNSGKHLSPSKEREAIKEVIAEQFTENKNQILLQEAEEVYQKFVKIDI